MANEEKKKPEEQPAAKSAPEPAKANLTRDSLELTLRARLMLEGKSDKDATAEAKRRAAEMVRD